MPRHGNARGVQPAGAKDHVEAEPIVTRVAALTFAREAAGDLPEAVALVERMAKVPAGDDETFYALEADLDLLLMPSPLLGLPRRPSLDQVENALRGAAATNGSDPLTRETRRRVIAAELQELGVKHPQRLVDAAFSMKTNGEHEAEGQGATLSLEDPEPWPEPVAGSAVLEDVAQLFRTYVVLPPGGPELLSLWTAHTWAIDCFDRTGYLALVSPTKRCGKTIAVSVLSALVRRALSSSNLSPAALFRVVQQASPTLLIDEADRIPEDSDLWQVLNAGHTRGSKAVRVEKVGDRLEARAFATFGAKALAYIRPARSRIPDTLEDRTVRVTLQRKQRSESRERLRSRVLEAEAAPLRRKLARWVEDNRDMLASATPAIPNELDDRAADSWEPLLVVATIAGGPWSARARDLAIRYSAERAEDERESEAWHVVVLADLGELLARGHLQPDSRGLAGEEMARALRDMPDRPWRTWGRKPERPEATLNAVGLARLLRPFGLRSQWAGPKHDRAKRYSEAAVREAAARFAVDASAVSLQPLHPLHRPSGQEVSASATAGATVQRCNPCTGVPESEPSLAPNPALTGGEEP